MSLGQNLDCKFFLIGVQRLRKWLRRPAALEGQCNEFAGITADFIVHALWHHWVFWHVRLTREAVLLATVGNTQRLTCYPLELQMNSNFGIDPVDCLSCLP